MFEQPRFSVWALPSLLAGIVWIQTAASLPFLGALPVATLGALLGASGVMQLLAPGDHRVTQLGAVAGLLGALFSVPALFFVGLSSGLGLLLTALAGAWGAGRMAIQVEPHVEGVPTPGTSAATAAKVGLDEAILGFEALVGTGAIPTDGTLDRIVEEVDEAHALFAREGFLDKPDTYHVAPPELHDPEIRIEEVAGQRVEILRFESGYAPADDEPGRDRWLGYAPSREGFAYVLRHEGPPRPWLIATNGYRMGRPRIDVSLFARFWKDYGRAGSQGASGLGLNVLIPVLPLHGPRKIHWHSGQGFLGVDVLDTIHAETQGLWDMRRLLSWVQAQDAPAVGAFGLSLGGLTTANFASLATGLSAAVPGIPLLSIERILRRHAPPSQLAWAAEQGFDLDRVADLLRVITPTWLTPQVPQANRLLFGATADRLVTPDHVRDLWRHWDEPEIVWYDGSHISFASEPRVWGAVDRVLRESGLAV
ncbi:MAG: alpha/beta hydrolase [Myxococcota bacterium]